METMTAASSSNGGENKVVDRNWLRKLVQKHHHTSSRNEEEHQRRHELNNKFPILKDKALAVAPMVEQSDLPFRVLCRRYGANICYTPMIHAGYFTKKQSYRNQSVTHATGRS